MMVETVCSLYPLSCSLPPQLSKFFNYYNFLAY